MVQVEVYADIWCPFTHVGLHSFLQRRIALGREDSIVHVRAWPLELINGKPLDPNETSRHVDELRTQVAPDLFTHFDPSHFPHTTLPALALAAAAYRRDVRVGERISLALRNALFEEGRDISRHDVLAGLARTYEVVGHGNEDDEVVQREWYEGEARGVRGSPHFFCGQDLDVFCPSLDISKDEAGRLQLGRSVELLDAFLAECLK